MRWETSRNLARLHNTTLDTPNIESWTNPMSTLLRQSRICLCLCRFLSTVESQLGRQKTEVCGQINSRAMRYQFVAGMELGCGSGDEIQLVKSFLYLAFYLSTLRTLCSLDTTSVGKFGVLRFFIMPFGLTWDQV